jgi:hypothetical protein
MVIMVFQQLISINKFFSGKCYFLSFKLTYICRIFRFLLELFNQNKKIVLKWQALHRRQLLSHIEKQTKKIRQLMEVRLKIQKARQLAEAQAMWAQGRE